MQIYFERWTGRPSMPDRSGDPIIRDWPFIPPIGAHLSFDVGDERPVEGNVRAVHVEDSELKGAPNIRVVFSS